MIQDENGKLIKFTADILTNPDDMYHWHLKITGNTRWPSRFAKKEAKNFTARNDEMFGDERHFALGVAEFHQSGFSHSIGLLKVTHIPTFKGGAKHFVLKEVPKNLDESMKDNFASVVSTLSEPKRPLFEVAKDFAELCYYAYNAAQMKGSGGSIAEVHQFARNS